MKYGVEIVISTIILIIVLFIIGYTIRKKYYKEIDRLESSKIELFDQPVVEELAKLKKLNMAGKTEEKFEGWREEWDVLVTERFPHIDELLFDAEEYTDKFNFPKVKDTLSKIEIELADIERDISTILHEVKDLTSSEESNRSLIGDLKEAFHTAKKRLLTERHSYGKAAEQLDKVVKDITEKLETYDRLTEEGDYLEAHQEVLALSDAIELLQVKMDKIPDLLTDIQTIIPAQKDELHSGYKDMEEQGYILDHLQLEDVMKNMDNELDVYQEFISKAEIDDVPEGLAEMKEQIELLYDMLEKEVYARHHVLNENEQTESLLGRLREKNEQLKEETELIQESYQLFDNDLYVPHSLDKKMGGLLRRFELLKAKISEDQSAFSSLHEELADIEEGLKKLENEQHLFAERLQSLRKDELEAQERITSLKRKINDTIRLVQKSRMPGLPSDIESLLEQANGQIDDVFRTLQEKPLNMKSVQTRLHEAEDTTEHLYERAENHTENAKFAEQVIQYGNRYRRTSEEIRQELDKAEQAFRSYEYRTALELAATAVEKAEPGALKRIEEMFNEEIHV